MANQQLVDYIVSLHSSTYSDKTIKNILLEVGWSEADVSEAFNVAQMTRKEIAVPIDKAAAIQAIAVLLLIVGGSLLVFSNAHTPTGQFYRGVNTPPSVIRTPPTGVKVLEASAAAPAPVVVPQPVPPVPQVTKQGTRMPVTQLAPPPVPLPPVPAPVSPIVTKTANGTRPALGAISFTQQVGVLPTAPRSMRFIRASATGAAVADSCASVAGTSADQCYHALAFATSDSTLCGRISDAALHADCILHFAIANRDKALCQPLDQYQTCFAAYASALKDPTACNGIISSTARASCVAAAQ